MFYTEIFRNNGGLRDPMHFGLSSSLMLFCFIISSICLSFYFHSFCLYLFQIFVIHVIKFYLPKRVFVQFPLTRIICNKKLQHTVYGVSLPSTTWKWYDSVLASYPHLFLCMGAHNNYTDNSNASICCAHVSFHAHVPRPNQLIGNVQCKYQKHTHTHANKKDGGVVKQPILKQLPALEGLYVVILWHAVKVSFTHHHIVFNVMIVQDSLHSILTEKQEGTHGRQ